MKKFLADAGLLIFLAGGGLWLLRQPAAIWRDAPAGSEPLFDASELLDSARKNSSRIPRAEAQAPIEALEGKNSVIIVDAGSSGTRVYMIKFKAKEKSCVFRSSEELLSSGRALAQLSPETLPRLLNDLSKEHPKIKEREIRIIGTGGFRTLDAGDGQDCGTFCSMKRNEIASALKETWPNAHMRVVSGEEEAKLGWLSVAVLNSSDDHASVEIGNSTAQLAFKEAGRLKTQMATMGSGAVHAAAQECELPVRDYPSCLAAVEKQILGNESSRRIYQADLKGAGDIVGLGGGFRRLGKLLRHFFDYETESFNPYENAGRVETLARELCRQDAGKLLESGAIKQRHVNKTCTQLVMELLLIKKLQISRISEAGLEIGAAFANFPEFPPNIADSCKNYSSSL